MKKILYLACITLGFYSFFVKPSENNASPTNSIRVATRPEYRPDQLNQHEKSYYELTRRIKPAVQAKPQAISTREEKPSQKPWYTRYLHCLPTSFSQKRYAKVAPTSKPYIPLTNASNFQQWQPQVRHESSDDHCQNFKNHSNNEAIIEPSSRQSSNYSCSFHAAPTRSNFLPQPSPRDPYAITPRDLAIIEHDLSNYSNLTNTEANTLTPHRRDQFSQFGTN